MMEWLVTVGVLLVVLPGLYLYTVSVVHSRFPKLRNRRICLLIAHPDDEAMFFSPTVLALARPETGNHVKILCLSSGNADGLGETRKKELVKSGLVLGLRKPDDVFVVDNQGDFPDSMTQIWDTEKIKTLLISAFAPQLAASSKKSSSSAPPTVTIDVLITFDKNGISHHPNHRSLYHGARSFVSALTHNKPGWACPVDLYTLTSVTILRKYASFLDVFATIFAAALSVSGKRVDKAHPAALVFASGVGEGGVGTAWRAMTRAHKSQMVWFRYGWITLSRYMVLNDLRLENAKGK